MNTTFKSLFSIICFTIASHLFAAPSDNDVYSTDAEHASYKLAIAAINQKSYGEAISHLDTVAKEEPDNADAYNMLGYSHRKLKNYETAERYYNKALAINPKHKGALEYQGELYVETQRMALAKENLSKLDDICWISCKELTLLKSKIEEAEDEN